MSAFGFFRSSRVGDGRGNQNGVCEGTFCSSGTKLVASFSNGVVLLMLLVGP